jgi:hypothetical protein
VQPSLAQPFNRRREVIHVDDDAVPAAGLRLAAIQHRFGGSSRPERCTEHQFEIASREQRKVWWHSPRGLEAEVLRVELDGRIDVIDHVADPSRLRARFRAFASPFQPARNIVNVPFSAVVISRRIAERGKRQR